jgi:two-component system sensor histidine kinase DesK
MIFSVFGLLIPNGLIVRGDATAFEWVMAGFGAAAFVALSAVAVYSWQRHRPFLWVVVLLVALGFAYIPMTFAGTIFFGLAAHMLPWAVGGNILRSAIYGTVLVALVLAGYWWMPEHGARWLNTSIYYALTIIGQVWIVRLCMNLHRLAAGAERERIADDLHDLLGEALSKITLKAQQAGRLLGEQGDSERARAEIAAAEKICRNALADVRQTIRAYRAETRAGQGRMNVAG